MLFIVTIESSATCLKLCRTFTFSTPEEEEKSCSQHFIIAFSRLYGYMQWVTQVTIAVLENSWLISELLENCKLKNNYAIIYTMKLMLATKIICIRPWSQIHMSSRRAMKKNCTERAKFFPSFMALIWFCHTPNTLCCVYFFLGLFFQSSNVLQLTI
jgi:hypothetical protein